MKNDKSSFSDCMGISCTICLNPYVTKPENEQQHPHKFCENHHVFCKRCCSILKKCPICKAKQIASLSIDTETFQRVEAGRKQLLTGIQMIPVNDLEKLENNAIGKGLFADIFQYKWTNTLVAIKRPRIKPNRHQMDDIKLEAALFIKIKHSNIVTLFGLTQLKSNYIGLVMEWSDLGNLRENMEKMNKEEKIKVSLCICKGLNYMHLIQIAHRELKPENVLLFGDKSKAKISDFGTSNVIQTIKTSTSHFGTPKYTAPELMGEGLQV
jgi:serine/threonine protein kinase